MAKRDVIGKPAKYDKETKIRETLERTALSTDRRHRGRSRRAACPPSPRPFGSDPGRGALEAFLAANARFHGGRRNRVWRSCGDPKLAQTAPLVRRANLREHNVCHRTAASAHKSPQPDGRPLSVLALSPNEGRGSWAQRRWPSRSMPKDHPRDHAGPDGRCRCRCAIGCRSLDPAFPRQSK